MAEGSVEFLTDENISSKIIMFIGMLGDKSIKSMRHPRFQGLCATADQDWIQKVTDRGFICITYDRRMTVDATIAPYLANAQARVIFICKHLATSRRWEQALWWLRYWPKIREHGAA